MNSKRLLGVLFAINLLALGVWSLWPNTMEGDGEQKNAALIVELPSEAEFPAVVPGEKVFVQIPIRNVSGGRLRCIGAKYT